MEGKVAFIMAMMLATYPVRLAPFIALSGRSLPVPVVRWMNYIPPAVFGALVFPGVLMRDGALTATVANPYLWAAIATFAATLATWNISKSVIGGVVVALAGELLLR